MAEDRTAVNVSRYISPADQTLFGAERILFESFLRPGMIVVDAGCGDGRLTRYLERMGAEVIALDLHQAKLKELKRSVGPRNVHIVGMDLRSLGLRYRTVDAFVLGFNVIDFIFPEHVRHSVLAEIARTLRPGGYLMFSSHNPVGMLLSPRGLRSMRSLSWRARYLLSGDFRRSYFSDPNGLLLYQSRPRDVVRQITTDTAMAFVSAANKSGTVRSLFLLDLFSAWPYYLFRATED